MTLKLIGLSVIAVGLTAFAFLRQTRKGKWKEAWISSVMIICSLVLYSMILAHRSPPSLVQPYRFLFESLGKMLLKK